MTTNAPTPSGGPFGRPKGCLIWGFALLLPFGFMLKRVSPWVLLISAALLAAVGIALRVRRLGPREASAAAIGIGLLVLVGAIQDVHHEIEQEGRRVARIEAEAEAVVAAGRARESSLAALAARVPVATADPGDVRAWLAEVDTVVRPLREVEPLVREPSFERALSELATGLLQRSQSAAEAAEWEQSRTAYLHADRVAQAGVVPVEGYLERASPIERAFETSWAAWTICDEATATATFEYLNALQAHDAYVRALARLEEIRAEDAAVCEVSPAESTQSLLALRNQVAARASQLRRENQVNAAQQERCGPAPQVWGFRDTLPGAEEFERSRAHDPSSIRVEACEQPSLSSDRSRCWLTACTVRGKNAFGALVAHRAVFETVGGRILTASQ